LAKTTIDIASTSSPLQYITTTDQDDTTLW